MYIAFTYGNRQLYIAVVVYSCTFHESKVGSNVLEWSFNAPYEKIKIYIVVRNVKAYISKSILPTSVF